MQEAVDEASPSERMESSKELAEVEPLVVKEVALAEARPEEATCRLVLVPSERTEPEAYSRSEAVEAAGSIRLDPPCMERTGANR